MLRRFRDLPDGLAVKSILDSAGIECLLGDEERGPSRLVLVESGWWS
jgi:hypothetical protein